MNKFQPPMRFGRFFLAGFQSSPEVSISGAVQKDRGLWGRDWEANGTWACEEVLISCISASFGTVNFTLCGADLAKQKTGN